MISMCDGGTESCPHNKQELKRLLQTAKGARSILEVGSRAGKTLRLLAGQMSIKGRVVSVDMPDGPWGFANSDKQLIRAIGSLKAKGYDAHLFLGNSQNPDILKKVRSMGPFDFVFIDGDHSYAGASADWKNYGPLGKTVVFHDVLPANPKLGVWRLWQEIEGCKETFVAEDSTMGLGIFRR